MDTPAPDRRRGLVFAATTCAIAVLASQLAGKAARDAIFLQRFAVSHLPLLLAVSSAISIVLTFAFARRLRKGIPVRVVATANIVSAALLVVEYLLLDQFPRPVATIIFMHQTLLGPILVSGFWSVVTECFDPRTARKVLSTVGTGATVGALLGAVLSERVAAMIGTNELLLAIAVLQILAMWRLLRIRRNCPPVTPDEDAPVLREAIRNITHVSLLRRLAIVTVVVTVAAALLDYVFKASATHVVKRPDDLARLFALFHGVVGILTALVQWIAGRWALQKLGLARTLATLPGAVILFGVVATIFPGIGTYVALRGAENVFRNSLYREAYEVFYTPLLAAERRATKTVIDVGVERFGDMLGGIAVMAIIAFAAFPTIILLVGAIALSAVGMIVALQAQRSYVEALERSLAAQSIDLEKDVPHDLTTRMVLARTSGAFAAAAPRPVDRTKQLVELTSGDPRKIKHALAEALSPAAVSLAIPLLDKPELAELARRALARAAPTCIGQLADALRDSTLSPTVRAELPALIAGGALVDKHRAGLAVAGLVGTLHDGEVAVRRHTAEALAQVRETHPVVVEDTVVFEAIRRELAGPAAPEALVHVASLLALTFPAEPIKQAFAGLHSEDAALRGVALEYLENVLPDDLREQMWVVLAIEPTMTPKRPLEDVLAELLGRKLPPKDEESENPIPESAMTQVDLPVARIR